MPLGAFADGTDEFSVFWKRYLIWIKLWPEEEIDLWGGSVACIWELFHGTKLARGILG